METSPEALTFVQIILEALPSVGIGAIFLYLFIRERKINSEMTQELIAAYQAGVEAQVGVKGALDNVTKALDRNTDTIARFMERGT